MLQKLITAIEGYKTHILVVVGVIVAVTGHFRGPYTIGSLQVPTFSWNDVAHIAWTGGLFSALHAKK